MGKCMGEGCCVWEGDGGEWEQKMGRGRCGRHRVRHG